MSLSKWIRIALQKKPLILGMVASLCVAACSQKTSIELRYQPAQELQDTLTKSAPSQMMDLQTLKVLIFIIVLVLLLTILAILATSARKPNGD